MPSVLSPVIRLSILVLLWPALIMAQSSLSVNTNQPVRTVDEKVFGVNAVLWDGNTATPQTISLLQAAGVRTIRIPGGSLSDEYHWRLNKSINKEAAPPLDPYNTNHAWPWSAGFNQYITLITGLNAQAFVTVNYGTGTPEEAAAWVAYANSPANILGTGSDVAIGVDAKGYDWKTAGYWSALRNSAPPPGDDDGMNFLRISRASPVGLQYWEIGNENYGTWETDERPAAQKNDPYTYAIRSKDYIAKMKAVDPTIKIGVVAQPGEDDNVNNTSHPATNPRTGAVHNGWTPVMLTTLKASPAVTPDYLIYHRYEQAPKADAIGWGGAYESDATLLQKAKTWPNDVAALRQQLSDYLGGAGSAVQLMITENNSVYAKPGKQTTSLVNGLYLADSICNVMQTEINGLLWWDLRNGVETGNNNDATLYGWRSYGDYGILASASGSTTVYDPYPTYYAFKMLSNFARGGDTVVSAASNNTLLSLFAVKRANGSLSLLVINKDPTNSLSATIALTGFTPGASATVYSYGKPQDTAGSSADIATSSVAISGSTFSASFTSYSMTVISLDAALVTVAPTITTHPPDQTANDGGSAVFTVATSGTPTPTLQWQRLPAGSGTWANVSEGGSYSGTTTTTLTVSSATAGMDGDQFRCVATNSAGSATSNAAALTVIVAPSSAVISITVE